MLNVNSAHHAQLCQDHWLYMESRDKVEHGATTMKWPDEAGALRHKHWPKLRNCSLDSMVAFHQEIAEQGTHFGISLLRLEAVNSRLADHGFCAPGYGYWDYGIMGRTLLSLLRQMLSNEPADSTLTSLLETVRTMTGHGYTFFTRVYTVVTPIFDVTRQALHPT